MVTGSQAKRRGVLGIVQQKSLSIESMLRTSDSLLNDYRNLFSSQSDSFFFNLQLLRMAEMKDDVQASENQIEQRPLASRYNMQIVRNYLKNGKVSLIAIGVVWVVYFVECLYTWITFSTAFGLTYIPGSTLVSLGGNVPILVRFGEVYRLFTATILHAGFFHIFMNSTSLLVFCAQVEATVSLPLYLAVLIIGGIQGNMLSDLFHIRLGNQFVVGVGASTCICAVMGLYMAKIYVQSKKNGRLELAKRKIITMLIYLFIISLLPSVDFFGHFGSLISGGLIGLAILPCGDPEVKQMSWLGIAGFAFYSLIIFTIFI